MTENTHRVALTEAMASRRKRFQWLAGIKLIKKHAYQTNYNDDSTFFPSLSSSFTARL